jgi:hypothetical protein
LDNSGTNTCRYVTINIRHHTLVAGIPPQNLFG